MSNLVAKAVCKDCSWFDYCQTKSGIGENDPTCGDFDPRKDSKLSGEERADIQRSLDISSEIEKVIDSGFDINAFSMIDDRDFPCARNVAEYAMSQSFANMKPYAMQLSMLLHLFNDFCPYCSDMDIVENPPVDMVPEDMVDRIALLHFGVCPKCGKNRLDFIREGRTKDYQELAACIGQRSGKSLMASLISSYMLHRHLKMFPSPARELGIDAATVLSFTMVALTAGQAETNTWVPFTGFVGNNKWFNQYHDFLRQKEKELGRQLLWLKQTFYYYGTKRLSLRFTGPDKRTLRGATRFGYLIDEIGWFGADGGVKYNADEVNQALVNSCQTVRAAARRLRKQGKVDLIQAMSLMISSPSHASDKIMRLVREADDVDNRFAMHKATWEINPDFPREHFDNDFKTAPVRTMRDFGAVPPLSENPFIEDWKSLSQSCTKKPEDVLTSWIKFQNVKTTDNWGTETQYFKVHYNRIDRSVPRIMAVDAGYNYNAFAFLIGHLEPGKDSSSPFFHTDLSMECRPGMGFIPINFPLMLENCLLKLADILNLQYVVFDRWNSIDPMQRFKQKGIRAAQYSVNFKDFLNMKHHISAGHYIFPKVEVPFDHILNPREQYELFVHGRPNAHLMLQLLTIRQSGKQILKGGTGTSGFDDDMARCLCLASSYAYHKPFMKFFLSRGSLNNGRVCIEDVGTKAVRSMGNTSRMLQQQRGMGGSSRSSHATLAGRGLGRVYRER